MSLQLNPALTRRFEYACPKNKSFTRRQSLLYLPLRPHRLSARTAPFQGAEAGSIPAGGTMLMKLSPWGELFCLVNRMGVEPKGRKAPVARLAGRRPKAKANELIDATLWPQGRRRNYHDAVGPRICR